jgi:hypothetical protein
MAEIVERLSGMDFQISSAWRVAEPLGIPHLRMGLPRDQQYRRLNGLTGAPM